MAGFRNPGFALRSSKPTSAARPRNARFAPEFLERRLSPSTLAAPLPSAYVSTTTTTTYSDTTSPTQDPGLPPVVVPPPPVGPSGPA